MVLFLILAMVVYLAALGAVAYLTRPGVRRMSGALAGGAATGLSLLPLTAFADAQGWWRCPFLSMPGAPLLASVTLAVSYVPMALIGWRIDRRFGWRGLALSLAAVCLAGPPRDSAIASRFPNLMVFAPGAMPLLGNAAVYLFTVALTLAVMRLVAGPATEDHLAT